jgi:hypothetical protein
MGKPWNQPAVKIEVRDRQIVIEQGTARGPVGFVRRDASVTLVSRDPMFHSLHAGGAAFFTLTLPDAHRARTRALHGTGPVELTSAAGFYWMRAHLFVDEHPYYARTGPDGSYVLDDVPPGKYELVCWLPDWHEARRERDPESGQVTRVYFGHPVEIVKSMIVETGKKAQVSFFYRTGDFGPNRKR